MVSKLRMICKQTTAAGGQGVIGAKLAECSRAIFESIAPPPPELAAAASEEEKADAVAATAAGAPSWRERRVAAVLWNIPPLPRPCAVGLLLRLHTTVYALRLLLDRWLREPPPRTDA